MKRKLLMLLIGLGGVLACYAQPNIQIEWQRTIGGSGNEGVASMSQTPDGGYIFGGTSDSPISGEKTDTGRGGADYWVIKTNDTGGIEWQKTIGGSGHDKLRSLAVTSDAGYILGGESKSGISGEKTDTCRGNYDYWILKLNNTGSIEWQKTYGGSGPGAFAGQDYLYKIIQTQDGGYLAGGYSNSGIVGDKTDTNRSEYTNNHDYWILKLDALGAIEWQKTVGGNQDDRLYDLMQTSDGGYLLGGTSTSTTDWIWPDGEKTEPSIGYGDYWIVKLDAAGGIEWDKTLGGDDEVMGGLTLEPFSSFVQTEDGSYLIAGSSFADTTVYKTDSCRGGLDYWVIKIDSLGNPLWNKIYGGNSDDWLSSIIYTDDGGFMLHGYSWSPISGEKTDPGWGNTDYWVLKCDDTGTIEWQKTVGGLLDDYTGSTNSLLQTVDGNYLLAGSSSSGNLIGDKTDTSRGFGDFWIVKLFEACPDTIHIAGTVCSAEGYLLPWDSTVYAGGVYSYAFESPVHGSKCDSIITVTLTGLVDTSVSVMDSTLTAQDMEATYQWIDCGSGEPIAGATSAEYTAPVNAGSYAVIVSANGCTDTSACYTLSGTGINDLELNRQLNVYPNPAQTQVTIESTSGLRIAGIRLFNVLGAEVYHAASNGSAGQSLDIRQLANGMYLLHIETDKGVAIQKLYIIR